MTVYFFTFYEYVSIKSMNLFFSLFFIAASYFHYLSKKFFDAKILCASAVFTIGNLFLWNKTYMINLACSCNYIKWIYYTSIIFILSDSLQTIFCLLLLKNEVFSTNYMTLNIILFIQSYMLLFLFLESHCYIFNMSLILFQYFPIRNYVLYEILVTTFMCINIATATFNSSNI